MNERSNQQWLDDLRGVNGKEAQWQATIDLYRIITKATMFYLRRRRKKNNPFKLAEENLEELCQEFSRAILIRFRADEWALLDKFSLRGSFKGWVAVVCQRDVANELRKPYWNKPFISYDEYVEEAAHENAVANEPSPERRLLENERNQQFQKCWAKLSSEERATLFGRSQEMSSADIAKTIPEATADSVNGWASRGRGKLRKCMEAAGYKGWRL